MVLPIYARKAAPTARARPPKETMLAAAAPVASGTAGDEVPLAPPAAGVEAGLEALPLAEPEAAAELAAGALVLPAGEETTELAAEGTTAGTELTMELTIEATEEATTALLVWSFLMAEKHASNLPPGAETAGAEVATAGTEAAGVETAGAVADAGGAWI